MSTAQHVSDYLFEFDMYVLFLLEMDNKLDESLFFIILVDSLTEKFKEIRDAFDTANEFFSLHLLKSTCRTYPEDEEMECEQHYPY